MQLFYSGAVSDGNPSSSDKSLGGFCSNTQVPNGTLSNVFSIITRKNIIENQREVKMIVLKNTGTSNVNTIRIWSVVPTEAVEQLRMAAILPAFDSVCSKYYFEQILNSLQLPYQSSLASHEGEVNAIEANITLEPGKMIGIWVERTFKTDAIDKYKSTDSSPCSTESIASLTEAALPQSPDELGLVIDYAVV